MKKKESIISWAFLLSIFVLLLMVSDLLALSDISSDYVSTKVLVSENIELSKELPSWTSAAFEWSALKVSLFLKFMFMIVIVIGLTKAVRKLKL